MALTLWRPRSGLASWQSDPERWFDRFFSSPFFDTRPSQLVPPMDVTEDEHGYKVSIELPGVDRKDVSINVVDGTLLVKGEKKTESEKKDEMCYCTERSYGSFQRSLALPDGIDADKAEAHYTNGILEITLPKAQESKPREVKIKVK